MSDEKEKVNYDEILEKLEKDFIERQKRWNDIVEKLSNKITCELKKSIELSAEATSQRQLILDERTNWYYKMYRDLPKLKQLRKKHFEWYSTKYPIKVNGTEKTKLIEADLAYQEAKMECMQNYINFLTESIKTVDHVIYSVKTKVDLYNATGLD
ncbi:MAG: hypothetical protein HPY57_14010 [Ignavibacteria bacterium]|nr:hypothetical protein [Ignavibacteria bacterium]